MGFARASACAVSLLLGIVVSAPVASAFGLTGIGGKVGFVDPESADGTLALGGHLEFEQRGTRLHLLPNVLWWNTGGVTDVNPNFDVYYHFDRQSRLTPYLGAGVGLHIYSFEGFQNGQTDLGANLFGGLRLPADRVHFFVEGRYAITDVSQLGLLGGVTFHL